MANLTQPLDGLVVTEFELLLPKRAPFVLDRSVVNHASSTLTEKTEGSSVYEHTFITVSTQLVDQMLRLAMSSTTPTLRFRYGVETNASKFWMPWQNHLIVSSSAKPQNTGDNSGHILVVVTRDYLSAIDRVSKVTARKGKISDIVKAIAQENGLESVVEPTKTDAVYYQDFTSDTAFIQNRLLARAVNAKGLANYLFFMRDGVLHFHTIDYQADLKSVSFFDSTGSSLILSDSTQSLFDQGIGGTRYIIYDPYTGQAKEVTSDPSKTTRLSQTIYPTTGVNGAQLNIGYHLSSNGPDEAAGLAQTPYSAARLNSFGISVEFPKLINLRAGDFINLTISQQQKGSSPYGGYWYVSELTHAIKNGTILSRFSLIRGENQKLPTDVGISTANAQTQPELTAPGQDLNLLEIQSSASTKGAGKQTSEKVYTTVSDANKSLVA